MRLANKVAIVSGAASGMGAATARRFGKEGAKVVIADQLEGEGKIVAGEIENAGGTAVFMPLNVTDEAGWNKVVADTVALYGRLGYPGEQRGHQRQRGERPAGIRHLGPGDGGQRDRRVSGHRRRRAADAKERRRVDRQPVLDLRHGRPDHGAHGLQRVQGRGADDDQVHRRAIRQGQHSLQFRPSGLDAADAHLGRDGRSHRARENAAGGASGPVPARSMRSPTRSCSWRPTRRPTSPAARLYVDGGYLAM